jgi:two-component system chemotaxis response regulator CheB
VPIKVLLVDDSPTSRQLLSRIIESTPDLQIIGEAFDGLEAIKLVEKLSPDVVLMDVTMPHMDGLEATREIMNVKPTPIVVISGGLDSGETNIAFEAINAGALSVLKKPGGPITANYEAAAKEIQNVLRAMAGVRVIRHTKSSRLPLRLNSDPPPPSTPALNSKPDIVAIASSTGGPQTLAEILKNLPRTFNLPVVIVQHISADFVAPLVYW